MRRKDITMAAISTLFDDFFVKKADTPVPIITTPIAQTSIIPTPIAQTPIISASNTPALNPQKMPQVRYPQLKYIAGNPYARMLGGAGFAGVGGGFSARYLAQQLGASNDTADAIGTVVGTGAGVGAGAHRLINHLGHANRLGYGLGASAALGMAARELGRRYGLSDVDANRFGLSIGALPMAGYGFARFADNMSQIATQPRGNLRLAGLAGRKFGLPLAAGLAVGAGVPYLLRNQLGLSQETSNQIGNTLGTAAGVGGLGYTLMGRRTGAGLGLGAGAGLGSYYLAKRLGADDRTASDIGTIGGLASSGAYAGLNIGNSATRALSQAGKIGRFGRYGAILGLGGLGGILGTYAGYQGLQNFRG